MFIFKAEIFNFISLKISMVLFFGSFEVDVPVCMICCCSEVVMEVVGDYVGCCPINEDIRGSFVLIGVSLGEF